MENKSKTLEKQNKQLVNEKAQLQQQVADLFEILNQMKGGAEIPDLHKRFKLSKVEEQYISSNESRYSDQRINSNSDSDYLLGEGEISDLFSIGDDANPVTHSENWLSQNEILKEVDPVSVANEKSTTNDKKMREIEEEPIFEENEEKKGDPELILHRGTNNDDLLQNIFGESTLVFISQASMFGLTVVMWLVLCLCVLYSPDSDSLSNTGYQFQGPSVCAPMSAAHFISTSNFKFY